MRKSARLSAEDVRAVYRLVGECRDLGDDAVGWRRHLFAGVSRLVSAGLAVGGEMAIGGPDGPRDGGTTEWGWEHGFDRSGWVRSLDEFARDPGFSPLLIGYLARLARADGVCLSRTSFLRDEEWYPSAYYDAVQRVIGVDETLVCFRSLPAAPGEFSGMFIGRTGGDRPFGRRDELLVEEAHALLAPLVGGPLARFSEPSPAALPPRTRAVLRCLLEGDADKQIAARLVMARHTVNQHAKLIFRHFGVESRAELLARWVKRGWSNGFVWENPDGS